MPEEPDNLIAGGNLGADQIEEGIVHVKEQRGDRLLTRVSIACDPVHKVPSFPVDKKIID